MRVRARRGVPSGATTNAVLYPRPPSPGRLVARRVHEDAALAREPDRERVRRPTGQRLRVRCCGCARVARIDGEVRASGSARGGTRAARRHPRRVRMPSAIEASCSAGSGCHANWTSPTRSGARAGSCTRAGDGSTSKRGADDHAGTCCVMQCTPPPPYARTTPGHRNDVAARILLSDRRGTRRRRRGRPLTGTATKPFPT